MNACRTNAKLTPQGFFLLQALFDLIVQSPMNKTWPFTIFSKTNAKAEADDRNPPSQDCSSHPGKNNAKATSQHNRKRQKWWKQKPIARTVQHVENEESHTAIGNPVLTRIIQKVLAHREKVEIPISNVNHGETKLTAEQKETGCLSPSVKLIPQGWQTLTNIVSQKKP